MGLEARGRGEVMFQIIPYWGKQQLPLPLGLPPPRFHLTHLVVTVATFDRIFPAPRSRLPPPGAPLFICCCCWLPCGLWKRQNRKANWTKKARLLSSLALSAYRLSFRPQWLMDMWERDWYPLLAMGLFCCLLKRAQLCRYHLPLFQ